MELYDDPIIITNLTQSTILLPMNIKESFNSKDFKILTNVYKDKDELDVSYDSYDSTNRQLCKYY